MSRQYFSIQQLSFNIGFYSKEKGYELQNKISHLYHRQLHTILQNFFYRTVPQNTLIRKDSLLLDLGSLSYNELESELPKRLEKALEEQFSLLLINDKNALQGDVQGFESVPAEAGYEFLLDYFLNTGTLPWQASAQPQLTWRIILQELYLHDRTTLSSLLYKLGHEQSVRIRLAFQTTDEDIQQIITAVEPADAPFILTYKKKIETIQQKQQLVRSDASGFRQAIAYFILTYLFEEKESLFSQKEFIKSVLHQMAAHYNISFTALLKVLYEALPAETSAGSSHSFFALVQALFMENRSSDTGSAASLPTSGTSPIALLEFFLVTGQLPKQSTAKGTFTWQAVLDELYERDRDQLNILMHRLGRQYAVRKRLAYQLTEEALQKVFGVIEPAEAAAIIVYKKNIVEVQHEKRLVMATGTDLRRAVSFFILTYLLEERGSIFSKRMFIKSVLRQMADHYNVSYSDLLEVLYEAVPGEKLANAQQASFFQTIQDIYEEERFAPYAGGVTSSGAFSTGKVRPGEHSSRSIPEILLFFLQYGAMPSWAIAQSSQSPETLLQQLYAYSVEDALQVMKRAGRQERSKQRFVWQFSEPLLYKVFSHLPEWNKATAVIELIIQVIEAIPALGRITQRSLKHSLLDALWSSYIDQGYIAFNSAYFYTLMLEQLSYLTTIKKEEVVHFFHEAISQEKEELLNAESYEAIRHFEQALNLFSADNTVITMTPAEIVTGNIQHGSLDSLVRQYARATTIPSGEDRLLHIITILEYYLTWNRFPDSLHALGKQERDRHFEEMLLLLYQENREALKRLLHSDKHSATARMHLHHLFTISKGGDHKQVSLLLDGYLEKDALQYLKEMAGNRSIASEAGLKQALDHLLEKAKSGMGEETAELLRDLLRKIKAGINLPAVDAALIQLLQVLERHLQQRKGEEARKKKAEAAARKREEETKALQRQQQLQKQKEQDEQAMRRTPLPVIDKGEKLYITNAGLVLLHPFISTYFTRLNLIEKGQFVNREAQARAVHLLQYLVYNTTEHPEHELVLNKILCNFPLHEPLPLEITPEPHEVNLSAEMLQVVIQRAGKLSNSTVDGFRVSFLHREGVLTETEEAWTLRVEQRGYDMILQMLPWAFGTIKFSWMDKPVYVEWM